MKKLSFSLLAALMLFNFAGCKKEEAPKTEEPAAEAPKAEEPAAEAPKDYCSTVNVDSLKALAKIEEDGKRKVISNDSYVEIMNAVQCCDINEKSFQISQNDCPAYQAINAIVKEGGAQKPQMKDVMAKLIKNDSPKVRAVAYSSIANIFTSDKSNLEIGKEAIKTEKDPYALSVLVRGLTNSANKDPEVGKFLIDMSKHENVFIRRNAAMALANPNSDQVEGIADAVIAMFDDSDDRVVQSACTGAGRINDDKVIEPIVKILNDESKSKIHTECLRGLAYMWLDHPHHKKHDEKAYKATMDYLMKKPRTKTVPAFSAAQAFNQVSEDNIGQWKQEATWFKLDEFVNVMTDLIKDKNVDWIAKPPAILAISAFGGKAELNKIKPIIDGLGDENVKKAYEDELAKAK